MSPEWREAAVCGSLDVLQRLIAEGSDIDGRDGYGQTALMLAAAAGRAQTVEWLAQQGAELDCTAKYRLTPLMLAVIRGHLEVVAVLVAAGADLSARASGAPGLQGKTALDLARDRKERAMVTIICEAAGRQPR